MSELSDYDRNMGRDPTPPNYAGMNAGDMLTAIGLDGAKWADAFCQINPSQCADWGLMLGWFCNAIETAKDAARAEAAPALADGEVEGLIAELREMSSFYGQSADGELPRAMRALRSLAAEKAELDAAWLNAEAKIEELTAELATLKAQGQGGAVFQVRVGDWMAQCFSPDIALDRVERCDRFIEEALELIQACGSNAGRAHALVDYVFGRAVGDPPQEVGGVMVTLAALCNTFDMSMATAGEVELARINRPDIIEKIRAKQAAKPTGSALPVALPTTGAPVPVGWKLANEIVGVLDAQPDIYANGVAQQLMALPEAYQNAIRFITSTEFRSLLAASPAPPDHIADAGKMVLGWQPIETAPKDGMVFVAGLRVFVGGEPDHHDVHLISVDPETDDVAADFEQGWRLEDYEFWMPLPAPPANGGA